MIMEKWRRSQSPDQRLSSVRFRAGAADLHVRGNFMIKRLRAVSCGDPQNASVRVRAGSCGGPDLQVRVRAGSCGGRWATPCGVAPDL